MNLLIAPKNYISGFNNIDKLDNEIRKISKKPLIVIRKEVYEKLESDFSKSEIVIDSDKFYFTGECCFETIEIIKDLIIKKNFDSVVGIGGGKLLDTVKASGYLSNVKIITVPTSAATCAAWSSHAATYTKEGISYNYFPIHKNADLLFMDKKIIFEAPIRLIKSGIIDSLAKWVETDAFTSSIQNKNVELEIAIYLAKKIYDDILEIGEKAIDDINKGVYSEEVDKIIEHNILTAGLVGGVGGEACRAVASHAVNNGFTVFPQKYNNNMHGEMVGFGNIVQLLLDKKVDEAKKIIAFTKKIDAPISLNDFGFENLDDDKIDKIINKTIYKGDTIWNLPYKVDFEMVKKAFLKAIDLTK